MTWRCYLNKVATTYWDNPQTILLPAVGGRSSAKTAAGVKPRSESVKPQWMVFAVVASMTLMLCMAINLRSYSVMSAEAEQSERLNAEIEQLTNENLAIQEEIHNLKTDSSAIEREARKIGLSRPNEKVPVSAN